MTRPNSRPSAGGHQTISMDCPAGGSDRARWRGLCSNDVLRLGQGSRSGDSSNQRGERGARQPMRGQDLRERSRVQRFVTKAPPVVAGLAVVVQVGHRRSDVAVFQAVQGTDYRRLHGDEARQHQDNHKSPPALPGHVVPGPGIRDHNKKLVESSDSATDLWRSLPGRFTFGRPRSRPRGGFL